MLNLTQRSVDRVFPWAGTAWRRGAWVAALLSLLLHAWMLNTLNQSFDFKLSQRSGTAPLSTRLILTSGEQERQTPADLMPLQANAPAAAQASRNPSDPTEVGLERNASVSEPVKADNLEKNRSSPGIKSASNAIESVANNTPTGNTSAGSASAAAQQNPALRVVYPRAADLEYEVVRVQRGQTSAGPGWLRWKSDGNEYELLLEWSDSNGLILRQHSAGKFDAMGLAPERFSDKRANRSEQAAHFKRFEGVVVFSNNKPQAPIQAGLQDPLSVLIQLAGILGGDPIRFEIVNVIRVSVAGLDDVQLWEMSLEKPADINVAAANMRAMKLQRKPRNEFDPRLEIWLAPQLGYLPIRIRQSDEQNPETNFTEFSLKRLPF
jgi:Protein of unknown function (DUF3108)